MTVEDDYCMPVYNNSPEKKMGTFLETYILESMMNEDRGSLNGTMTRNMSQQPNLPTKKKLLIRELPDA